MLRKSLFRQTLGAGLLLLSGCDVARNAQHDLTRLLHATPESATKPAPAGRVGSPPVTVASVSATPAPVVQPKADTKTEEPPENNSEGEVAAAAPVDFIGKSEGEVRALLGPPTSVEERAPGKTWHYRIGECTADIQLYPDVQTRQFGTLAYEVKSDDNTDEGRRSCLVQFSSRARSYGG